jgi:hypothetical protein
MHRLYKYSSKYMSCVRNLLATSLSTVTLQLPISLRLLITEYWMMWSSFNWTIVFILGIIKQMYPDTSRYTYMHHQTIFCWCFCGWTFIWPLPKWVWHLMHHNRQCNDVFVYKRSLISQPVCHPIMTRMQYQTLQTILLILPPGQAFK